MNMLDIIVLIVIGGLTAYGIWKGCIKQVFSILGIICGYVVAMRYYSAFSDYLKFSDPNLGKIISFIILFIACVIVFGLLALLINKIFRLPGLGLINSFFGGVIGFLKGFLLAAIAVIFLIALLSAENPILSKSLTVPYILRGIMKAESMLPRDIKVQYSKKIDNLMKEISGEPEQKPDKKTDQKKRSKVHKSD
jgi:membrane protein required for colicin V production